MSRFAPVHLPEGRELNDKGSQTFLRHMNLCPRSAYLYQANKGGFQTVEMMRGTAVHEILERCTRTAIFQGEPMIPGDVAKAITAEVLGDPAFPVPLEEHDYVREAVYRWAAEATFDTKLLALESLFVLDINGFEVRCKIDRAYMRDGVVRVEDYKSGRGAPSQESVARKRPDEDGYALKAFQLILYLLALKHGRRMFVQECEVCHGTGAQVDKWGEPYVCESCDGARRFEMEDDDWTNPRAERWEAEFVFPGIETRDGEILRRGGDLTATELDEYLTSMEGLVARVRHAEESGDWPAVVSDEACGMCPAAVACPIPSELRDHRGVINSAEQAAEAAEVIDRMAAAQRAIRDEIKAFCKAHGISLRFGRKVFEFVPRSSVRVDREGLQEAWERHQRYGEEFRPEMFQKTSNGTDFRARDLTAEELAAEEGSNG
jgi:hypothetical protein